MGFNRLIDIPYYQQAHYPQEDSLAAKREGQWRKFSTQEVIDQINQVSRGLLNVGIQPEDKIAIVSTNRPEWNFIDLGMQQIQAVSVPVYPRVSEEIYHYIFDQAEIKLVFAEDQSLYEKVQRAREGIDSIQEVYTFEPIEGAKHWRELIDEQDLPDREEVEARKSEIDEDMLATIIYTSGTTGMPKGVMLTHKNIVSNIKSCINLLPIDERHRALSFLPLNHIFERMLTYLYMTSGVSIYYAESIGAIGKNLNEIQPHIFSTVPRLLEKVYERIVSRGLEQDILRRGIFLWSLQVAQNYELQDRGWLYNLQWKAFDRLVYRRWREGLGGDTIAVISGGASLNPMLARVFTAAGIPILEGYGLTETSPVLAVNRMELEGRKIGTVGRPVPNVEIKIAEDEEILCRGPNVTQGYFKKPQKTDEAFDEEGWFHTGDVGGMDEEGFLKIADRKKAVFKTSGGKYVAPKPIEQKFEESFLISHAVVIGEDRKMVTALFVPDFENLKEWCENKNVEPECEWTEREEVLRTEPIRKRYDQLIQERNKGLSHTEKIKNYRLVPDDWSVESGELTPTMKVKRAVVKERYEDMIEDMYGG